MADEIAGAKNDIADLLAPYGYYFVGNDDRAELHLVFVDLGIAALAVLAWGAAQYLKSFLTETGKLHAQGLAPKNSASADSPEKHVNDMILDQLKLFSAELRSS